MTGKCWDSIELLTDETDITRFCCGVPEIDLWFQGYALEAQDESGCAVYVALRADGSVVGFFTLSMYMLQKRSLPGDTRERVELIPGNIPAVLLGKFGVDSRYRGREWRDAGNVPQGPLLIAEAVSKARELAKAVGCRLMYVNALNDGLAAWYRRKGFLSLPSKPNSLVLDLRAK